MPSMSIARWLTGEKIRTEFGNPMVAGTPARGIVAHRTGVSNLRVCSKELKNWHATRRSHRGCALTDQRGEVIVAGVSADQGG